ncbi:MAG: TIGR02186 family protein [Dehalococcoidales bacterium]|nr:TIGR02186 family protein [Dehalococcoidales bacterium]
MRLAWKAVYALLPIALVFLVFAVPPARAAGGKSSSFALGVTPAAVEVDINYAGAQVKLSGRAPAGTGMVAVVSSKPSPESISKKGKRLGFLWMTTGQVEVENVPAVYLVYSSGKLDGLVAADEPVRGRLDSAFPLVDASVLDVDHDDTVLSAETAQPYLEGLQDIRQSEGLYGVHEGGIEPGDEGWQATVDLPAAAPPGAYAVTAYFVRDGRVVDEETASFVVEKAGLVSTLANLAHGNPSVYGGFSVFLAVILGLGVGRVFSQHDH